ncbi:class I SAM-dependent methyltransferase [Clostridium akagii]|uniref:class I SAM-dependent methyltransferase n=1 Tax=Clostridium akagii TaxID=91623 RepID=UPI0004796A0C|nr:class I SAM-dependent methyltransferase [Clostridium akagii]
MHTFRKSRQKGFEIDHPATCADKQKRIQSLVIEKPVNLNYVSVDFTEKNWESKLIASSKFNQSKMSFCSLLGLSYYLSKETFSETISSISSVGTKGSTIVFDYPDEDTYAQQAG